MTLQTTVSIQRYNPFKKLPEDSIIIGHYSLENSCLIKTYNVTENTVETFLTKEIQERYNITWTKTKLPTIHPSILVWLCKQPKVNEIIVLSINKELTYFKIPSLRWFTQKL